MYEKEHLKDCIEKYALTYMQFLVHPNPPSLLYMQFLVHPNPPSLLFGAGEDTGSKTFPSLQIYPNL